MRVIYEDNDVIVKPSSIEGLGVFAKRIFKKGEVVLKWNPKKLSDKEKNLITPEEKRYINKLADGTTALMQIPERYVNSSNEPNTTMIDNADVALRNIKKGEEITSSYPIP